jgi:hypothetical protein
MIATANLFCPTHSSETYFTGFWRALWMSLAAVSI